MKELSIEEKARAYDRALAKAKEEAIDGYLDAVAVNDIFPEIIEGEDERIRENCIHFLELQKSHHASTVEIEECIAWLEQGEQKPNYCHHEVDLSRCSKEYRKAYYDGWNNCNMQHSQCNSEKNDVIKCLINGMKFYYEDNEEATWGTDKWSMPVKHIIEVLEAQGSQNFANSGKTCKDEQNRWKPSELQLECLNDAIKHYQSNGSRPVILVELLKDLKKLK